MRGEESFHHRHVLSVTAVMWWSRLRECAGGDAIMQRQGSEGPSKREEWISSVRVEGDDYLTSSGCYLTKKLVLSYTGDG